MKALALAWDIVAVASIALIGWGVYLIHFPSALITVGALLLLVSLAGARARARGSSK